MMGMVGSGSTLLPLDRWLDADRLISDLASIVAIPSVNPFDGAAALGRRELEAAEDYQARMAGAGLETEVQTVAPGRVNVWGRFRGLGRGPSILLAGHLDTVGVEDYDDPFSGGVRDGKLYGRGACDMKAALAAFLEVARVVRDSGVSLPGDLIIAGLCDEEHMMLGSKTFVQIGLKPSFAIVGEPTGLAICPAHSGQVTFFIRTFGKAVHSSRPEMGENAILRMAQVLAALDGYGEALRQRPHHPLCGFGRFSPGVIRGGTISSAVPAICELEVDRRTLPGETPDQVLAELHARIAPLAIADPTFRYEIGGPGLDVASLDTPADSPIVQSLIAARKAVLGEAGSLTAFPGGTDAPYLGCASVICGPGDLLQAHTLNEFVEIRQVVDAVRLYVLTIFDLMGLA